MPQPLPRRLLAGALLLSLAACAEAADRHLDARVDGLADPAPRPEAFHYCYGYGCDFRPLLALGPEAWRRILEPLGRSLRSPLAERRALARAYRRFEIETARRAGTGVDLGGTFPGMGRQGQLDCVDEAVNTTQFLRLVAAEGLLRRHVIGRTAHRGNLFDAWPHVAATLVERGSGRRYVLDPWFFDSGVAPVVLPFETWVEGGDPLKACPAPTAAPAREADGEALRCVL